MIEILDSLRKNEKEFNPDFDEAKYKEKFLKIYQEKGMHLWD